MPRIHGNFKIFKNQYKLIGKSFEAESFRIFSIHRYKVMVKIWRKSEDPWDRPSEWPWNDWNDPASRDKLKALYLYYH